MREFEDQSFLMCTTKKNAMHTAYLRVLALNSHIIQILNNAGYGRGEIVLIPTHMTSCPTIHPNQVLRYTKGRVQEHAKHVEMVVVQILRLVSV